MGDKISKLSQTKKECNVECQENKKKINLYSKMKLEKIKSLYNNKKYKDARLKYFNHIYGPSWIKNKKLKSENSKLKTYYDKKLQNYQSEFKSLAKYYIDSLFLLKNQKKVINKNKIYSEIAENKLKTQKVNINKPALVDDVTHTP